MTRIGKLLRLRVPLTRSSMKKLCRPTGVNMCEPLTIASAAMGIMGTAVQYQEGKANAKAQSAVNKQNYETTMQAYRDNHAELQYQNQQEWSSAQSQATQSALETRQVESSARVAAGESGIMGASVDALMRDIGGQGANNQSNIYANYLSENRAISGQLRNERNRTASTVSGLAPVKGPNGFAAALKIGSQAVDSYSSYKSGKT
jgi:hypothetical protein